MPEIPWRRLTSRYPETPCA